MNMGGKKLSAQRAYRKEYMYKQFVRSQFFWGGRVYLIILDLRF